MRKPAKDKIREDRIHNEAIVDAYGSEEKAMSWYYYLENKIRFPFQAKRIVANLASPIKKGEIVEVRRLAPDDACSFDILVLIRWQGRSMAAPLSHWLPSIRTNPPPKQSVIGITGSPGATSSESRWRALLPFFAR